MNHKLHNGFTEIEYEIWKDPRDGTASEVWAAGITEREYAGRQVKALNEGAEHQGWRRRFVLVRVETKRKVLR